MKKLLGKNYVIFLAIYLMQTCKGQSLDQESLNELQRRKSGLDKKRFPSCMRDDKNNATLWCDESRYNSILDLTIDTEVSIFAISSEIRTLMVNDSCLQTLNQGDLAHFDHLTTLVAENNFLTILKTGIFSDNPDLEEINLSRNEIQSIQDGTFEGLALLLHLDLGGNSIDEISQELFTDLSSLEYLSLPRNQIQLIPKRVFISLTKLTILKLEGNRISQIHKNGFDELSELEELDLSNNKIQEIKSRTFHSLTKLRKLNLRGNQINTYPSDLMVYTLNLEFLDLGSNHLHNLANETFSNLRQLRILKIDHNSLTRIGKSHFYDNENLELLNLSANALQDISANAFSNNRILSTLLLQSNHLHKPEVDWFAYIGSETDISGKVNLSDNEWWCDCTTRPFQQFMLKATGKNPIFSQQLDIHCSSNKEYEGRLSELDIFCPSDNSNSPIILKSSAQTSLKTSLPTKPALISILLDLPKINDPSEDVVTDNISTSSPATSTRLPTSKTIHTLILAVSSKTNAFDTTSGGVSISMGAIVALGVVIIVIFGGAVFLCKKSNGHNLRMWVSPRRDRYSSRQPFLEEIKVDHYDGRLPEPFSGSDDEDITFTRSPTQVRGHLKQPDAYQTIDEETFYTPRTTPRPTTKMAKQNPRHVAEETST